MIRTITIRQARILFRYARSNEETALEAFARRTVDDVYKSADKRLPIEIPTDLDSLVRRAIGPTDEEVRALAAAHVDALTHYCGI